MNNFKKNNQSISQLADKLIRHYQIPFNTNKKEAWNTIIKKINQSESINKPALKINWYIRAAVSVAATAAIIVIFLIMSGTTSYMTGESEIVSFRLPDQSRVVLHHNSTLKYKKYFRTCNVQLTGKAYFEVAKNNNKFKVNTESGNVEVLGTRFLVESNNQSFNVECFQGSVRTHFDKNSWVLEKGTKFSGDDQKMKKISTEAEQVYPDFAIFKNSYSNEKLPVVIQNLESFFGVEIEIKSGTEKHFTGTIQTGNIKNALQMICEPLHLKYMFTNKNKINITQL
jgi:ferric-dicitrate binding protein FerR (iron transport regulator)